MGPLEIKGLLLLAAIGVGGLAIWIGYRLYLHGVIEKGRVDAEGAGLKVTLADYGPGVAFALFGAFIIIFAVTRSMSESESKTTTLADGTIESTTMATAAAAMAEPGAESAAPPSEPPVPADLD